ncbi:MAG: tetratricopeptide repeat protein [Deltaproteobacteria bacterium]|nr:MAG: tetratricopeptide repeat protein [Deltaproteobacteria bacterium]
MVMTFAVSAMELSGWGVLLALGLGLGWALYRFGFRGLQLPTPIHDAEKLDQSRFYDSVDLQPQSIGMWAHLILAFCMLATMVLASGILYVLQGQTEGALHAVGGIGLPVTMSLLLVCIGFLYTALFVAHRQGRLSPEVQRIWESAGDRWVLVGGALVFVAVMIHAVTTGRISIVGVAVGLYLLPIVLLISRVEGRFFVLFLLQEYSRARNWSWLEGEPVVTGEGVKRQLGQVKRVQAVVAMVSAGFGVLAIPLVVMQYFGEPSSSGTPFWHHYFQQAGVGFLALFLSLGPLATLATRPFGFLSVWLNQRLYEQITSRWDIRTMNQNIRQWGEVVRFPQPNEEEGFGEGLAFAGGGIIALVALTLTSQMITSYGNLQAGSFLHVVFSALEVLQLVSFFVLLASLAQQLFHREEAVTAWLFAEEGRRADMDLINHSLYGLHWLKSRFQEQRWIEKSPKEWGLPWILFGINDHPNLPRKAQKEGLEKAVHWKLPPMMKPVAWQQLGSFFVKNNQWEEARDALQKGLEQFPKFSNLWASLMRVHLQFGDEDKAKEAYEKAVVSEPENPAAYANWAAHLANAGRAEEAKAVYLAGLEHCPTEGLLLHGMGLLEVRAGNEEEGLAYFQKAVDNDPTLASGWLILADAKRDHGDLEGAAELYRKGISVDPYNSDAWQGLGEVLLRSDEMEEAEKAFRKSLEYNTANAIAWNNLAVTLREMDDPEGAVEAFRTALQHDASMHETWTSLAEIFMNYGMWSEAEGTMKGALQRFPGNGNLLHNLALVIRQQGRVEEALTYSRQAAEAMPEDELVVGYLGELEEGGGLLEGVEEEELELPDNPEDPDEWQAWAEQRFGEGMWGEAEQGMMQSINLDPDNPQRWAVLGDILNQQSRAQEAEGAYQKALLLDPSHMGAQINLGVSYMQQARMEDAKQAFRSATEIDPTVLSPWTYLFYITSQAEEWDENLALHQEALEHLPESPEIYFSFGYQLACLAQMDDAEAVLTEGIKHAPEHSKMRCTLGDVLFHQDRRDEAIAMFQSVIDFDPENVEPWLKKATVHLKSQQFAEADVAYRQALELHPGWTEALFNLSVINTILGKTGEAFYFIEQTLESNPDMLPKILEQPDFDVLYNDPRWQALTSA